MISDIRHGLSAMGYVRGRRPYRLYRRNSQTDYKFHGNGHSSYRIAHSRYLIGLFLISAPLWATPPKVLLSTTTLLPGETLRIEVEDLGSPSKLKVLFLRKLYP